jgi:hypothetical protein
LIVAGRRRILDDIPLLGGRTVASPNLLATPLVVPAVCRQYAPLDNSRYFRLGAETTAHPDEAESRLTVEPFAVPAAHRKRLVALSGDTVKPPELELLELDELEELLLELDELLLDELLELDELELLELELDELPPVVWICMPLICALSITVVKRITICPPLLALVENCWILAMYSPPAVL